MSVGFASLAAFALANAVGAQARAQDAGAPARTDAGAASSLEVHGGGDGPPATWAAAETAPASTGPAGREPSEAPPPANSPIYETVVTAVRPTFSAGAVEVEAPRLARALPQSGSETLALVPGLRIVQHGAEGKAHQIFLRGFDAVHGSDVEVRLAGIVLNERTNVHGHGYVDLYGVVPEAVRAIRVDKGPFLGWQGDFATAGSVSFELGLAPELRPGLVRIDAGHRGRVRVAGAVAPTDSPDDVVHAAEAVRDPGFGPDREATRGALLSSHTWPLHHALSLTTLVSAQAARWQSPGALRLRDAPERGFLGAYGPAGRGESDRLLAGVLLQRRAGASRLELGVHAASRRLLLEDNYTGYLLDPERGDRKRQWQSGASAGASLSFARPLTSAATVRLRSGAGWRLDTAAQSEEQIDADGTSWQRNRNLRATVHGLHAYLGLHLVPWRWLDVLPSLRGELLVYRVRDRLADRRAVEALGALLPRLAMALTVHPAWRIFADYGRGLRSPEPRSVLAAPRGSIEDAELAQYAGGRPAIATADAVELGVALTPFAWGELRAAAFGTFIEREIVFDHVSNTNLEMNATRRLGLDLAARVRPWPWLGVMADLCVVDARFRRSRHHVPGSSPWSGRASLFAGRERGAHGSVDALWAGPRHLAHEASASGYVTVELVAGWRFRRFDIVLAVDNLSGADTMDGVYHYASWFDRAGPRSSLPLIHYTAGRPRTARLVLTAFL